jgi:hypothetical protein
MYCRLPLLVAIHLGRRAAHPVTQVHTIIILRPPARRPCRSGTSSSTCPLENLLDYGDRESFKYFLCMASISRYSLPSSAFVASSISR